MDNDPFAGLGKALAQLRKRAGFATQTEASEALKIDKGQLSRWENDVPQPSLENLGRVLAGYGASVADLAEALEAVPTSRAGEDRGPSDEELIRSLAEAIRRVEGRQVDTESRVERIERGLEAAARPLAQPARPRTGEG
jgi:transcriptional regulator with XRE-family HTH domain